MVQRRDGAWTTAAWVRRELAQSKLISDLTRASRSIGLTPKAI